MKPYVSLVYEFLRMRHYGEIAEALELRTASAWLNDAPLRLWDIGAHHGWYVAAALRIRPKRAVQVVAVEPIPANRRALKANLTRMSLSRRLEYSIVGNAIGEESGIRTFYFGQETTLVSQSADHVLGLDKSVHSHSDLRALSVQQLSVSAFISGLQATQDFVSEPNIVKIDTEGMDLQILARLIAELKSMPCYHFEVSADKDSLRDIQQRLVARRYRVLYFIRLKRRLVEIISGHEQEVPPSVLQSLEEKFTITGLALPMNVGHP